MEKVQMHCPYLVDIIGAHTPEIVNYVVDAIEKVEKGSATDIPVRAKNVARVLLENQDEEILMITEDITKQLEDLYLQFEVLDTLIANNLKKNLENMSENPQRKELNIEFFELYATRNELKKEIEDLKNLLSQKINLLRKTDQFMENEKTKQKKLDQPPS